MGYGLDPSGSNRDPCSSASRRRLKARCSGPRCSSATCGAPAASARRSLYGLLGTFLGGLAAGIYQFLLGTLLAGVNGAEAARDQAIVNALSTGCIVIILPVLTVLSLFINAGITHVMLLLLNGARHGFETTMRVAAYAHGSAALLNLIPLCGGPIGSIWALVLVIIGIARAHEIPTGKAAAAVLIPVVVCCVLVLVFYAAIVALVVGAVMAGTSHQ